MTTRPPALAPLLLLLAAGPAAADEPVPYLHGVQPPLTARQRADVWRLHAGGQERVAGQYDRVARLHTALDRVADPRDPGHHARAGVRRQLDAALAACRDAEWRAFESCRRQLFPEQEADWLARWAADLQRRPAWGRLRLTPEDGRRLAPTFAFYTEAVTRNTWRAGDLRSALRVATARVQGVRRQGPRYDQALAEEALAEAPAVASAVYRDWLKEQAETELRALLTEEQRGLLGPVTPPRRLIPPVPPPPPGGR